MEERILSFSREALQERKRVNYLLMIMLPITVVAFAYLFIKVKFDGVITIDLQPFITIIAIVTLLLVVEMFVVFRVMIKKISQTKIIVSDTAIKRVGGRFEETIPYEDIKKISVKRNKTNRILYIKVKNKRKTINLLGFDDMDFLLMQLGSKLKDESKIIEIKNKINWNSPMATFITFVGTALAISLIVIMDLDIYEVINLFFPVVFGIYLLISKPMSKNAGARFRVFEQILSGILIVLGLIRLWL